MILPPETLGPVTGCALCMLLEDVGGWPLSRKLFLVVCCLALPNEDVDRKKEDSAKSCLRWQSQANATVVRLEVLTSGHDVGGEAADVDPSRQPRSPPECSVRVPGIAPDWCRSSQYLSLARRFSGKITLSWR